MQYKEKKMHRESELAFCLPGAADEGLCPGALAQFLVNQHNDFVQRVDQAMLMRNQDVQRHATRTNEISSDFMSSAHALVFDTRGEFVPYVFKQCVRYNELGETLYDFGAAEKFLVDRYFRNKPLVNLRPVLRP